MRVSRCMSMLFEVHNYWFLIFIIFSLRWSNRWHSTRIRTAGCWRSIRFAVPNGLNSSSHCRAGPRSRSWGRCTPDIGCWTLLDQLESWKKGSYWYWLLLRNTFKPCHPMSLSISTAFPCFSWWDVLSLYPLTCRPAYSKCCVKTRMEHTAHRPCR